MGEGHSAKVTLDGDASGLNRAAQQARNALGQFTAAQTKAAAQSRTLTDSINRANDRMGAINASIGRVTTLLGGAGLVGVAIQAAQAIDQLSQRSLALSDVKNNLRISIDKARASTRGLVDDFTLQKTAMAGLRYGVFQTSEQMAKHVEIATTLARTLGTDSSKAVEDFTLGIARQSRLILDNLGILVDVDNANKTYAATLHKSVSALTDEEKAIAFRNEAYRQGEKAIKGMKLEEESWAAAVQKGKVAAMNLGDALLELPKNVKELGNELTRTIGIQEEAAAGAEIFGRVLLGTVTLGASEAYFAVKRFNEEAAVLGNRFGSVGFSGIAGIGTRAAMNAVNAQASGEAVMAGLAQSLTVGQRAFDKTKKKKRGGRRETPLSPEMIAAINESRAAGAFDRGASDTRDVAAAESEARRAAVAGQLTRGRDELEPVRREQAMNAALASIEEERARSREFDLNAELDRIERERKAKSDFLIFEQEVAANEVERLQLVDEQRQVAHEAQLQRIAAERQAEEERMATIAKAVDLGRSAATQTVMGVLSITDARRAATLAAKQQGKSDQEAAKAGKVAALEAAAGQLQSLRNLAITKAISETAEGLGALAMTWGVPNPAAILHFAAAGTWAAVGIGAGLGARGLQGRASAMQASGGGRGMESTGTGGGFGGASANGPGLPRGSDSQIPGSPGPSAPRVGGGSSNSGGGAVILDLRGANFYGTGGKKEFGRFLDESLKEAADNRRPTRDR